ncbi:dihydroxyacetone kinase subunit DhaL [Macrococcus lamae]|uniref:phosphoenolpyruvate--glycerone phosphotransferase n=1 Tax=Macrococcus lamae TaxID=198484 RepID=A0A4R6BSB2_9STAP|nr:dihydroxyacetone kinase subunit DhaL [Macrococcus lamae]TDM05247.1 dihydroxyacetone kinase subunit L [Macrococcus lamae]
MNANELKDRLKNLLPVFEDQEKLLTDLDREIGDGDHGVNMLRGFKAVDEKLEGDTVADVLKSCGMTLMSAVGGASGPLYGFSFVKMAQKAEDAVTQDNIETLLTEFKEAVAVRGKVEGGEKTMYDVISKASDKVNDGQLPTKDELQQLAEDTKDMTATKGRAAYFKEQSKGTIDPGAQSAVYILEALIGGVR